MRKRKISILNLLQEELVVQSAHQFEITNLSIGQSIINRRRFLKNVVKTGIGFTAGGALLASCNNSNSNPSVATVGILGAGIAGLQAAGILSNAQIDCRVFEASHLPGGRMLTVYDALGKGSMVELGGEFIDSNHDDILALVKEYGLELIDIHADIKQKNLIKESYYFNNKFYTEREVINEFRKYADSIVTDINSLNAGDQNLQKKFDGMSINEYLTSKGLQGWLFELLEKAFTAEYGLESAFQSSLNLLTMIDGSTEKGFKIYGTSDERYKIKGGTSLLINKMADRIRQSISFKHRCERISYSDGLYKLEFNGQPPQFCKYLIVTIPFTALRKVKIDLDLPEQKQRVIKELHYGTNSKISFGFSEAVWEAQGRSGYLFSSLIQNGWDGSLTTVNNDVRSFTIFQGGVQGKQMNIAESGTYLKYLNSLFPGMTAAHNGKVAVFNWATSSLSEGSYAVYRIGDWTSLAGLESVPVGNLYFAGEHCSDDFNGYMNGAAETGRKVAEQVIKKVIAD
jgi:monoamine oxidase